MTSSRLLALIAVVIWPGASLASGLTPSTCLSAINSDFRNSLSTNNSTLSWHLLNIPISKTNIRDITRTADLLFGESTPHSSRTFSATIDYVLRYHVGPTSPEIPTFDTRFDEYLKWTNGPARCRFKSNAHLHAAGICTHLDLYRHYRDIWLRAVESEETHSSPEAIAAVNKARESWDKLGYRQATMISLAHIRARDEIAPELAWDADEQRFLVNGGTEYRSIATPLAIELLPEIPNKAQTDAWRQIIVASQTVSYSVSRIVRNWLSPASLFEMDWTWNRGSPLKSDFIISDGSGCANAPQCFAEWLITMPPESMKVCSISVDLSGDTHVVALAGEPLPQLPPTAPGQKIKILGTEQVGTADLYDRLRSSLASGTF